MKKECTSLQNVKRKSSGFSIFVLTGYKKQRKAESRFFYSVKKNETVGKLINSNECF